MKQFDAKASAVIRSDSMTGAHATGQAPEASSLELEASSGVSLRPLWCDYTICL
jgi:hypothetical protein